MPLLFPNLRSFYNDYAMPLAQVLHNVERRGILVDQPRLAELSAHIDRELATHVTNVQKYTTLPVTVKRTKGANTRGKIVECALNAGDDVLRLLESNGLKIPMDRYTHSKSTKEDVLQKLLADTGHPVLKDILGTRELTKIKGTYVEATLWNGVLYCTYVSIGTVGGRRSSRANYLDIGTNSQNFPKHSVLGRMYRRCLIARPGKVFVSCDQKGADEWTVQGIITDFLGVTRGLDQLRAGVNRHKKLASFIFSLPESQCDKSTHDGELRYHLGKITRHGGTYGMQGYKMSIELAKDGFTVPTKVCDELIAKFHIAEPEIRQGYQTYVEQTLNKTRRLTTPIGRSRVFFGLRPYSDNSAVYREGYSYTPLSVTGDNTGLAILYYERASPNEVVADCHDSVQTEVDDNLGSVTRAVDLLRRSFERTLMFPNGTTISIPVEYEIGYNMTDTASFEKLDDLTAAYEKAKYLRNNPKAA